MIHSFDADITPNSVVLEPNIMDGGRGLCSGHSARELERETRIATTASEDAVTDRDMAGKRAFDFFAVEPEQCAHLAGFEGDR